MADVALIIASLNIIANAQYHSVHNGPPPSRKTGHERNFDELKSTARVTAATLTQNPRPRPDQRENISNSFATMKKAVAAYCTGTVDTRDVLKAFNEADVEWHLLCGGK